MVLLDVDSLLCIFDDPSLVQRKKQEALLASQQPASEKMVDTAPIISSSQTSPIDKEEVATEAVGEKAADVSISVEELKELSQAVQSLKADQDRTTLEELKEDREEYIEVSDFGWPLEFAFELGKS